MKLFRKEIKPKVFAIVLRGKKGTTIYMKHGYDFREAVNECKDSYRNDNDVDGDLYTSAEYDLEEIVSQYLPEKVALEKLKG